MSIGLVLLASLLLNACHSLNASDVKTDAKAGLIRDCADCPGLREIPAGDLRIVSNGSERNIHFSKAFLLSQYETTLAEYRRFVSATQRAIPGKCFIFQGVNDKGESQFGWVDGASFENPGYAQTDNSPAVCISWDDAVAYTQWLSNKTGHRYRLPTEAEFDYATRAGTRTTFYWGDDITQACSYANGADQSLKRLYPTFNDVGTCDDGHPFTAPIGSYQPNAFGLYDMIGNAWEWTADCQHNDTDNLPLDGSAYLQGNCAQHVRRSASWFRVSAVQRSALPNADWHGNAGFRVIREL
ncbi:MAG: SUMF1/EgtB/PvdO family nonheme iron enzyme [Steroidobacteraceae bacterium]